MELATERLILREFEPDDWRRVHAYQADERYLRFNEWTHRTPEDVRAFVRRFIDQQDERPRVNMQLAVTLAGELIGNCGIRVKGAVADIGYELAPDVWGNGYATEAARAIVRYGFAECGLHRISARCIADNTASGRVLEKLGMRCEARLRAHESFKGRTWDSLVFAVLRSEWR